MARLVKVVAQSQAEDRSTHQYNTRNCHKPWSLCEHFFFASRRNTEHCVR